MSSIKLDGITLANTANSNITLTHDIVTGTSSYGFAQLSLTANETQGLITWDTITGDTTNFTKPSSNHLIQLGIAGIYIINGSLSMVINGSERNIRMELYNNSGPTSLATVFDEIVVADGSDSYGSGSLSYTGYFPANSQIYFNTASHSDNNATVYNNTHASICLIRRTA